MRSRIWESLLLLLIAFTLFRPGYWLDQLDPPFKNVPANEILAAAGEAPEGADFRVTIQGPDFDDPDIIAETNIVVPLGAPGDGLARFEEAGLTVMMDGARAVIEEPFPGTPFFESLGKAYDFYGDQPVEISYALRPKKRIAKEVFYLPALLLLALVIWLQRRRQAKSASGVVG